MNLLQGNSSGQLCLKQNSQVKTTWSKYLQSWTLKLPHYHQSNEGQLNDRFIQLSLERRYAHQKCQRKWLHTWLQQQTLWLTGTTFWRSTTTTMEPVRGNGQWLSSILLLNYFLSIRKGQCICAQGRTSTRSNSFIYVESLQTPTRFPSVIPTDRCHTLG